MPQRLGSVLARAVAACSGAGALGCPANVISSWLTSESPEPYSRLSKEKALGASVTRRRACCYLRVIQRITSSSTMNVLSSIAGLLSLGTEGRARTCVPRRQRRTVTFTAPTVSAAPVPDTEPATAGTTPARSGRALRFARRCWRAGPVVSRGASVACADRGIPAHATRPIGVFRCAAPSLRLASAGHSALTAAGCGKRDCRAGRRRGWLKPTVGRRSVVAVLPRSLRNPGYELHSRPRTVGAFS